MAGTGNRFTRTKQSALAAAMPILHGNVERPEPPDYFTEEEQVIWRGIVDACPEDQFTADSIYLLAKLCTNIAMTNHLEAQYRRAGNRFADNDDRIAYQGAVKLVAILATKLRLSPQSRYDKLAAGRQRRNKSTASHLWQRDDDLLDEAQQ